MNEDAASAVTGATLGAGVYLAFLRLASQLALSSVFVERVDLTCGVAVVNGLRAGSPRLFDVISDFFFVSPLCPWRSSRTTPWSLFAAHVSSICGDSSLVYVEPADVSLEGRLGRESSARYPLFHVFTSGSFQMAASCGAFLISQLLCCHKGSTERRRNVYAAQLWDPWPSEPALAGRWERGRDKR